MRLPEHTRRLQRADPLQRCLQLTGPCFSYALFSGISGRGRPVDGAGELSGTAERGDLGEVSAPAGGMLS